MQDMMHKETQQVNCQQNTGPTKLSGRILYLKNY